MAGEDAHAVFMEQAIEQIVDAGFRPQQFLVLGTGHQHDGAAPGILGFFGAGVEVIVVAAVPVMGRRAIRRPRRLLGPRRARLAPAGAAA